MPTEKGISVAGTLNGTRCITEQLVISTWTVEDAVTDVLLGHTHSGTVTTVETGALVAITVQFILFVRTVVHAVAAHMHWQAVVVSPWTMKMRLRTRVVL